MINPDSVPNTIAAAAQQLADSISDVDRQAIIANDDADAHEHFGLGISLRNQWSLWESDSPLKRDAATAYRIAHADDIGGLILAWAFALVRGDAFDPQEHCQRYHEHWERYGTDSLTAGGYGLFDGGGGM